MVDIKPIEITRPRVQAKPSRASSQLLGILHRVDTDGVDLKVGIREIARVVCNIYGEQSAGCHSHRSSANSRPSQALLFPQPMLE